MLDLLISYFNFIVLSIGYIVKRFTFFPPDPPHYISVKTHKEDEDEILFLIPGKKKKARYIEIKFKLLEYRFIKIIIKENEVLPLLLFIPPNHIPVCIIYSHGNSGDLGACILEFYDIAINTNCLVVSFEYPGFGDCKNQPLKESLFYRNMKITYYFVRKILNIKPEQIILYGFSMGTGIMFDFACKKECPSAGMILQSPFLSIFRTLYNVNKTMYFDLFNNCDKAKYLKTKTFFIHGNRDRVVPYIHGRILAKLIPQEYFYDFLTVPNADHNNLFKQKKDFIFKRIREFIKDRTGYFFDFTKFILEDSSNTTIDNNNDINNDNNKDNTNNKVDEEVENTINKAKTNYNQKIVKSSYNELNPLVVNQLRNNNIEKNLSYSGTIGNNNENKSYLQFINNIFGSNKNSSQNTFDNYMNNNNNNTIINNSSMNNFNT